MAAQQPQNKYPQHEKLAEIQPQSQVIGEFLEWCGTKGVFFAEYRDDAEYPDFPVPRREHDSLLYEFFGIDQKAFNREKEAMYKEIHDAQKQQK